MMNEGGYITSEISQVKEEKGGEMLLGSKRDWEFTSLDEESFPPGT